MRYLLVCVIALGCTFGCRSPEIARKPSVSHASNSDPAFEQSSFATFDIAEHSSCTIEDLVFLGLANSPRLKEAEYKLRALRQRIPQELSLPDPMLNSTTHLLPVETAAGRQAFALGVSQKYVSADRRKTRASIAQAEVRAAEAELAKHRRELAEQIRVASIQLIEIRGTLAVTQEDYEALRQIEEVILARYEVDADVSQQDVLNVQIEQSKVQNQISSIQQRESSYEARLARLLHAPQGSSFDLIDELEDVVHNSNVDELIAQAFAARPELKSQLAKIQRERSKICLAHLQRKPDFTVGLNWIATSSSGISPVANGDDALMLGVGFNLPVYKQRIRAAVGEAAHSSMASTFALQSIEDQISEEVFDSITQLESTRDMLSLLQVDIIPKTERALDLSIEDYSNGNSDYVQVIANWRALLKFRIAQVDLRSSRMQLMAVLSRKVGQLEPMQYDEKQSEQEKVLSVAEDLSLGDELEEPTDDR